MVKKFLCGIAALAIAATIAFNMSLNANSNNLSDLSLANVEALASDELLDIPMWAIKMFSSVRWECTPDGSLICPAP
ncbi:MAG: NVEALA domain-containing protein [Bacteroidales bacterium]|nr:NVEALA domain-containing protein [Bacteroidales bacterium]